MTGSVRFEHDKVNDIHVAYVKWLIESEEDCRAWHKAFADYFRQFNKKVDAIFVCDELRLGNKIGSVWGRYRAELNREFTRFSVRVHLNAKVAAYTATSSAIHGAAFDQAHDVPTAVVFIREQRRRAAVA